MLFYSSDGVIVVVEVVREITTPWKAKIGVVSGVILKLEGIGVGRIGMSPFLQIPYSPLQKREGTGTSFLY